MKTSSTVVETEDSIFVNFFIPWSIEAEKTNPEDELKPEGGLGLVHGKKGVHFVPLYQAGRERY